MKRKIKYTDETMGKTRVVRNFLPPPEKLVLKESRVKITISLSKASVDFFKQEAKKHRTSYQKMIRKVIDVYTEQYRKTA
ncbi:MAG TPA: CopG family transcriptional regulator [Kiritimatiellia bacterium]|nr:CopG family transcriptional regulator [Kiritimatiellia bacterium]